MTPLERLKRVIKSTKLPSRNHREESQRRAWKDLNQEVAGEESRLKAMFSRRQSMREGAVRWKKTAENALKQNKIDLAREALKQEGRILGEMQELTEDAETSLEAIGRLKKTLAQLENGGAPAKAVFRGGRNRPGSEAYLLRLKERIRDAESLLDARKELFDTPGSETPGRTLEQLRAELRDKSSEKED